MPFSCFPDLLSSFVASVRLEAVFSLRYGSLNYWGNISPRVAAHAWIKVIHFFFQSTNYDEDTTLLRAVTYMGHSDCHQSTLCTHERSSPPWREQSSKLLTEEDRPGAIDYLPGGSNLDWALGNASWRKRSEGRHVWPRWNNLFSAMTAEASYSLHLLLHVIF